MVYVYQEGDKLRFSRLYAWLNCYYMHIVQFNNIMCIFITEVEK